MTSKLKAEFMACRIWNAIEIKKNYGIIGQWGMSYRPQCGVKLPSEILNTLNKSSKIDNSIVRCERREGHTGVHLDAMCSIGEEDRVIVWKEKTYVVRG